MTCPRFVGGAGNDMIPSPINVAPLHYVRGTRPPQSGLAFSLLLEETNGW